MTAITTFLLVLPLAHAVLDGAQAPAWIACRKVGGIHFIRIGRARISVCLARST